MLRMRPNSTTGTRMAKIMMIPPIVGTPFLAVPNGSMEASRCVSEMFLRFMYLMNRSPNHAEMTSERINVSNARNEMYCQRWEPGTLNWSKNLNK